MKVDKSQVTKLRITKLDRLDPITVYLEDFSAGNGKITIECFGESWSNHWGCMGDRHTITSFFNKCDEHYIAKKLSSVKANVDDWEKLPARAREEIISMRKDGELSKGAARDLWNEFDLEDYPEEGCEQSWADNNWNNLAKVFGDDWWYCIPTKPNHEYQYLCRIICAVQEGLKQINN